MMYSKEIIVLGRPGEGGVGRSLPYKRLMRMGSHFHDWIDNNGVAFSIQLLECGRTFSDFWGKRVVRIYS